MPIDGVEPAEPSWLMLMPLLLPACASNSDGMGGTALLDLLAGRGGDPVPDDEVFLPLGDVPTILLKV